MQKKKPGDQAGADQCVRYQCRLLLSLYFALNIIFSETLWTAHSRVFMCLARYIITIVYCRNQQHPCLWACALFSPCQSQLLFMHHHPHRKQHGFSFSCFASWIMQCNESMEMLHLPITCPAAILIFSCCKYVEFRFYLNWVLFVFWTIVKGFSLVSCWMPIDFHRKRTGRSTFLMNSHIFFGCSSHDGGVPSDRHHVVPLQAFHFRPPLLVRVINEARDRCDPKKKTCLIWCLSISECVQGKCMDWFLMNWVIKLLLVI